MLILSLETSCDETSAAVVNNGIEILSNIVATQTEFHKKYGGIVPEVAARKHIEVINPVIQEALDTAKITFKDIDAIAVTYGPGLVGSLIVGVCSAKAIAWALRKPLIGVNHLEGHIYANFLSHPASRVAHLPFMCLLVSGGHTMIIHVKDHGVYEVLGRTRDDAAGEAFDKVARVLGLGYPGGPIIDQLSKEGNPDAVKFKKPMVEEEYGYDFSFSGIKTAVVNYVHQASVKVTKPVSESSGVTAEHRNLSTTRASSPLNEQLIKDIASSFQKTVVETLVEKLIAAAKDKNIKTVSLAGGVSANSGLRDYLTKRAKEEELEVLIPPFEYCTDNAAMIGCAAYYKLKAGVQSNFKLKPIASLKL